MDRFVNSHVIEESKSDPKQHLSDTQQNRHLHFVGADKQQFVLGKLPYLEKRQSDGAVNIHELYTLPPFYWMFKK